MNDFERKALLDPHYAMFAKAGAGEQALRRAGFFDDGLSAPCSSLGVWQPAMPTADLSKVELALARRAERALWGLSAKAFGPKKPLVLLSTGAFSPVHGGHLAMMEEAKLAAMGAGYEVLGGFMSPSHDTYVDAKLNGLAKMHVEHRIEMLYAATAHSDWLGVCAWEGRYAPVAVNFTDVIRRLKAHIQARLGLECDIGYVFGSDNAGFVDAFKQQDLAICVQRPGHLVDDSFFCKAPRALLAKSEVRASSTAVRAGAVSAIPEAAQAAYRRWEMAKGSQSCGALENAETSGSPLTQAKPSCYLVRCDLDYGLRHWRQQEPSLAAKQQFEAALQNILGQALSRSPGLSPQVVPLSLAEQVKLARDQCGACYVLSLDVCLEHSQRLDVSRSFTLASHQGRAQRFSARPGYPSIEAQIRALPTLPRGASWTVVDDDCATGSTERFVQELLSGFKHPIGEFYYVNEKLLESKGLAGSPVCDIVDARDFLLGAQDAGLVVQCRGQEFRVPYMLPFVSLHTRAKLPLEQQVHASRALWKLNARWLRRHAPLRTLVSLEPAQSMFWITLGHAETAPLWEVAQAMASWLEPHPS